MNDRPKPTLDYSSLVDEQSRENQQESERRKALETYNQSTFGERSTIASALYRRAVLVVVLLATGFAFPRSIAHILTPIEAVAFLIWEYLKSA